MKKILIDIIVPLVIAFITFYAPNIILPFDISALITIVALIFTILTGFFISAATANYLRLQSLISSEDGTLISIFNLCKKMQPTSREIMADTIDVYAITALNYEMSDYVGKTEKEFGDLMNKIDEVHPSDDEGVELIQPLHTAKNSLYIIRQEINLASRKILHILHWFILIVLAGLIATLLLTYRTGDFFTSFVLAILIISVYLVLILVYQLDSNAFLEEHLAFQNTQNVFKAIGKLPYYPKEIIVNKRVKKPEGNYRVGELDKDLKREIKVVG